MDKDMQEKLRGFADVWRRVTDKKAAPDQGSNKDQLPALMPQKGRRAKRRFDP